MEQKIIFVDIDGTIVDHSRGLHEPTALTKRSFQELKAKGHLVFIASGRAMCLLPDSIKALEPNGYLLANGAYAEIDGKVIFSELIDKKAREEIMRFANEVDGAYYLETTKEIFTRDLDHPVQKKFALAWDVMDNYRDEGYSDDLDVNIAMLAIREDDSIVDKVYERLSPYVNVNRHGKMYSFDLNIKGNSKGRGIEKILDRLKIDKKDTYAFGDGYNDIEMIQMVANGIAMANGVKELKDIADYVTLDVLDDGFTFGLKKYRLL